MNHLVTNELGDKMSINRFYLHYQSKPQKCMFPIDQRHEQENLC